MTEEISESIFKGREHLSKIKPYVPGRSIQDVVKPVLQGSGRISWFNGIRHSPQRLCGELPCLRDVPQQKHQCCQKDKSQQVALPTREPATAPIVVPRIVLLDLRPPTTQLPATPSSIPPNPMRTSFPPYSEGGKC